jgi:hypothetical protein
VEGEADVRGRVGSERRGKGRYRGGPPGRAGPRTVLGRKRKGWARERRGSAGRSWATRAETRKGREGGPREEKEELGRLKAGKGRIWVWGFVSFFFPKPF